MQKRQRYHPRPPSYIWHSRIFARLMSFRHDSAVAKKNTTFRFTCKELALSDQVLLNDVVHSTLPTCFLVSPLFTYTFFRIRNDFFMSFFLVQSTFINFNGKSSDFSSKNRAHFQCLRLHLTSVSCIHFFQLASFFLIQIRLHLS